MAQEMYSSVAKPMLKLRAAIRRASRSSGIGSPVSVMQRKAPQDFGLLQPMLVELRRQFDEIGGDVGAGDRRIGDGGQKAMQSVAEFVEQRARVVEAQQRRLAVGRLGEIADIDDERHGRRRRAFAGRAASVIQAPLRFEARAK